MEEGTSEIQWKCEPHGSGGLRQAAARVSPFALSPPTNRAELGGLAAGKGEGRARFCAFFPCALSMAIPGLIWPTWP
jgi:hypothetical protein